MSTKKQSERESFDDFTYNGYQNTVKIAFMTSSARPGHLFGDFMPGITRGVVINHRNLTRIQDHKVVVYISYK